MSRFLLGLLILLSGWVISVPLNAQWQTVTLVESDPTWLREFDHFVALIEEGNPGNLATSLEISRILGVVPPP